MLKENFFILTGGPSAGKTTLIEAVSSRIQTVPEVAREIIKEQIQSGGKALPWEDTFRYSALMFERSVADFEAFQEVENKILFDRGLIDTIAYMRLINIPVPAEYNSIAKEKRYNSKVFLLPPWEEIFITDQERKQSFSESVATYLQLKATYEHFGYQTIEIPQLPVKERAEKLLSLIF